MYPAWIVVLSLTTAGRKRRGIAAHPAQPREKETVVGPTGTCRMIHLCRLILHRLILRRLILLGLSHRESIC